MNIKVNLSGAALSAKMMLMRDRAQIMLKSEVAKGCDKYVPFLSGSLRKSVHASINTAEPQLVYDSPYARYQYYGKVMTGKAPKKTSSAKLTHHTPGTGAQWFETWKASDGQATVARVKAEAGLYFRKG